MNYQQMKQTDFAAHYGANHQTLNRILAGTKDMAIPPGVYNVKIVEIQPVTTRNGMHAFRTRYETEDGRALFEWFVIPNSLWRFKKLFEVFGIFDLQPNTDDLIGLTLQVKIDIENVDGRIFNRIITYLKGLTPEQVEQIASMSPLDVLKLVYPDKDVESLMRVLNSQSGA